MRAIILLMIVMGSAGSVSALPVDVAPSQLRLSAFTSADGFANEDIHAVLAAKDGRLWIGTYGGLYVFDGFSLRRVANAGGVALPDPRVNALAQDHAGGLWVATMRGLVRLQNGSFTRFGRASGVDDGEISALTVDTGGHVWAAAGPAGVIRFDAARGKFVHRGGTPSDRVLAMAATPDGTVWAALGEGGLLRFAADGGAARLGSAQGMPAAPVVALAPDGQSGLYIGTQKGLFRRASDGQVSRVPLGAQATPWVRSIQTDGDALWVGLNAGLQRRQGGVWTALKRDGATSAESIGVLTFDHEGNLWAGTRGGLLRLSATPVRMFGAAQGLPASAGGQICETADGTIWAGNDALGLWARPAAGDALFTKVAGLPKPFVFGLACRGDDVWAAINGVGVGHVRQGRWVAAPGWPAARTATVIATLLDRAGRLWLGTYKDGLARRDADGRWRRFGVADGLPAGPYTGLAQSRDGAVWVGTTAGLARWPTDGRPQAIGAGKLPGGLIMALHEDADGDVWIGARDGLALWSKGRVLRVQASGDTPFAAVLAIQTPRPGRVWIASEPGIATFGKRDFVRAATTGAALQFRLLGAADGVQGNPLWAASGSLVDRRGQLWFAMAHGFAMLDPGASEAARTAPAPALVAASRAGVALADLRHIELDATRPRLDLSFSAPALAAAERLRFRYRLRPLEAAWTPAPARTAAYTQLSPGRYDLDVATSYDGTTWTEQRALATIVQATPLLRQPAFQAACAVAVALVLAFAYRLRVAVLQRRHAAVLAERTRIAQDLHDTLLQGLSGIAMQLRGAARTAAVDGSTAVAGRLEAIAAQAGASLTEARDAMWRMRAHSAERGDLPDMVSAWLATVDRPDAATATLHAATDFPTLAPDTAEALFRFVQEAVSNALRHAGASRIDVRFAASRHAVDVTVADDGRGFNVATQAAGLGGRWGLLGMRERLDRLGGRLLIDSSPGTGTTLQASVPR